ncbi:hypothetical protein [Methanobrevibacter sp. UBA212]|uniref:hypothetical protein n=1 Tax=Methanobrevibacter sp. UBA212 TaxID=1915476 RepID=UPI0025ED0939|nr:hypothetical protein [Methanobrevibacter sp. UBA212]MEE1150020.1 hypothetical protein [Methanobrevibacter sp.]
MPRVNRVHHVNDVTNVYFSNVIPKVLHRYFRLPGKFVRNYTTRIVKRDGSEGEMDWLILVEPDGHRLFEKILINVEFQSSRVTKEKIKIISEYKDYAKTYYGLPVLTVIIITDGYEYSEVEYSRVDSDILMPIFIRMDFDEIIERLNNLEEKILNHIELSEDDGLDMVFLPMFAPKKEGKWITEKVLHLFNMDKTLKKPFRGHVGYGISLMVKKYFKSTSKAEELLKMLEEKVNDSKLRIVAEFEEDYARQVYERKLADMDKAISDKNKALADRDKALAEKDEEIKVMLERKDDEIKVLKARLEENGISY